MGEEALIFNWRPLLRKSKYLKFHRNTEYVFNIHRKRLSTDLINFSSNLHPLALQSSQGDFSSLSMRELKRAPQILHLFRSIALDLDLIFSCLVKARMPIFLLLLGYLNLMMWHCLMNFVAQCFYIRAGSINLSGGENRLMVFIFIK